MLLKKVYGTSNVRVNGEKIKRIEYDGESDGHQMVLNVNDNGSEKQIIIPETNMQDFYNEPQYMNNHMRIKNPNTKNCSMKLIRINPSPMSRKRMQPRSRSLPLRRSRTRSRSPPSRSRSPLLRRSRTRSRSRSRSPPLRRSRSRSRRSDKRK